MHKSMEICAQEIWGLLEGSNMLSLSHSKVVDAVRQFKRAAKNKMSRSEPSELREH